MRKWSCIFVLFFLAAGGTASASVSLNPAPGFGPYLFTENFGPNGAGYSEGWFLTIGTFVSDPKGVPGNITSITTGDNSEYAINPGCVTSFVIE